MWIIYAVLTSIAAASSSILQKETLKNLHAVQLMTVTSLLLTFFGLFLIPFYGLGVSLEGLLLITSYSLTVSIATIFTIRSLRHLDISIVAPFFNIGTVFTVILAYLLFKEEITFFDFIGIVALVLGGYLLELKNKNLIQPIREILKSTSMHYLFGGVFLFSISFLIAKFALNYISPIGLFAYQTIISFIFFGFITFTAYEGIRDIKNGFLKGRSLILVIAILILIENILLLEALRIGETILVIPIYRTWTLWAVVLGGRIFHEKALVSRLFASLLMIIGVVFILL